MKGNTIIKNGRLMTMDEREHADWIVIEDDIIKAVGDGDGYKAYLAKGSKLIDAGPVSYTHLDVYKRQNIRTPIFCRKRLSAG